MAQADDAASNAPVLTGNTEVKQGVPASSASSPKVSSAGDAGHDTFLGNLANNGIDLRALYDQEIASNPVGGIKHGTTSSQFAIVGSDFDLDKLAGWKGGKFHVSIIGLNSTGLSYKYIGGGIDAQENFAPFNLVRFTELDLEQSLSLRKPNDLNLLAGRFGMTSQFARSDYACLFMNHVYCGPIYGFSQDTGTALAPLATWAARARYNFTPTTYAQAGVFANDPATLDRNVKLFDISPNRINGKDLIAEGGYETNFSNDSMPRHYRIGAWNNEAPRNDVYFNTNNLSFTEFGGTKKIHNSGSGVYAVGDQVIYRPDLSSQRNIAVFGSVFRSFASFEPVEYAVKIGLVKTGTFAGRNHDTLGVAISDTKFTPSEVNFLTEQRAKGGGSGQVNAHEYIPEIIYNYALAPGVTIGPDLQYIINPDPRYSPRYPRNIRNTLVVGIKFFANFGSLFGWPRIAQ